MGMREAVLPVGYTVSMDTPETASLVTMTRREFIDAPWSEVEAAHVDYVLSSDEDAMQRFDVGGRIAIAMLVTQPPSRRTYLVRVKDHPQHFTATDFVEWKLTVNSALPSVPSGAGMYGARFADFLKQCFLPTGRPRLFR
jgi:hypothetical protein